MTTKKFLFVLGAVDPEMMFIERALRSAGFAVGYATAGGTRVTPATAYRADDTGGCPACTTPNNPEGRCSDATYCSVSHSGASVPRVVWVECRPAGVTRAMLEARGDVVIDHHNPGDAGFGRPETDAFEASSVGQLAALAEGWWCDSANPELADETQACRRLSDALATPQAVAIGAADHCLPAALAGRVPRVDPETVLRLHAASWADEELAAALGRKPIPAAEVLAGIERDREAVRTTPCLTIGGRAVRDLTVLPTGTLPSAPAAASLEGCAYLALAPSRPGVPPTVVIGGDTTPACVEAFMAAARRAVAEHRSSLEESLHGDEWEAERFGIDTSALRAELDAFTKACAGARNGEGVYGDPARGFAGTYAPIAAVREALGLLRSA